MDLREGFDAFARQRRDEGSTLISRTRKKVRMAVREVGPMRFEADSRDSRIFDLLMEWKSQHFRRIRVPNPLAAPGVLDFLKRLLALRDDAFRGMVSVLYYGDRPAAAHVGIRCRNVLHSSVTAYNGELARYSPGIALAVELARAAEKIGICRIDLGAGNECFKTSFRSFGTQVAAGGVGLGSLATSMQRSWLCTKRWLQASRLHRPARYVFRTIRGLFLHEPQHDC
jgi:CelD/BcsL family acetyltransferase involved in cellulose biosynthesis